MATRMSVIFYHREQCHLCEDAFALLQTLGIADRLTLVDIDSDPELGISHGLRIPVIRRADGGELDWPFDAEGVRRHLAL